MVLNFGRFFSRCDALELRYCVLLNQSSEHSFIKSFFGLVSRLGDGILWYALTATLPFVYGINGIWMALQVLLTCLACLIIYKSLKKGLVRERPCISFSDIKRAAPALDRYSFPSGHTMHAVTFSMMLSVYVPQLALFMWAFTGLIALSRVILGLHYPTDVLAGALFGYGIGWLGLRLGSQLEMIGI